MEGNDVRFQSFALILATGSELTQTVAVDVLDLLGFSLQKLRCIPGAIELTFLPTGRDTNLGYSLDGASLLSVSPPMVVVKRWRT